METRQTTNNSILPGRKGFDVKKHTEHGLLRTILIQSLISYAVFKCSGYVTK